MNRAERRRQAKQAVKEQKARTPPVVTIKSQVPEYVIDNIKRDVADQCAEVANMIIHEAEEYAGAANILIMLYAIKMTIGNLKTVQKSYQKILENYNAACGYIISVGPRKAYEELRMDYGIEMEFEDFDFHEMVNGGTLYQLLKNSELSKKGGRANGGKVPQVD